MSTPDRGMSCVCPLCHFCDSLRFPQPAFPEGMSGAPMLARLLLFVYDLKPVLKSVLSTGYYWPWSCRKGGQGGLNWQEQVVQGQEGCAVRGG